MSIFNNFKSRKQKENRNFFPYIEEAFGTGIFSVEKNASVDRVVSKIANSLAILPLTLYSHSKSGKVEAYWDPVYRLIKNPAVEESPVLFWKTIARHILCSGNAYLFKHHDSETGEVLSLEIIDPIRVVVQRSSAGRKLYNISGARGGVFTDKEIIHIPYTGEGYDGTIGMAPCDVHRDLVQQNDIISEYISIFFHNSLGSRIVLELGDKFEPGSQKLERLMQELRAYFKTFVSGPSNAGKPIIAPPNTQLKLLEQGSNVQTDTMALYKNSCNQIYAIYNVPPEVLDSSQSKYASLEQKNQDFLTDCLRPLTLHIAQCLEKGLLNPEDTNLFLDWDYVALLEIDRQKAQDFYGGLFQKGLMSLNEARSHLNLSPVEDSKVGDTMWIQSSLIPNTAENIDAILAKSKLALLQEEKQTQSDALL